MLFALVLCLERSLCIVLMRSTVYFWRSSICLRKLFAFFCGNFKGFSCIMLVTTKMLSKLLFSSSISRFRRGGHMQRRLMAVRLHQTLAATSGYSQSYTTRPDCRFEAGRLFEINDQFEFHFIESYSKLAGCQQMPDRYHF